MQIDIPEDTTKHFLERLKQKGLLGFSIGEVVSVIIKKLTMPNSRVSIDDVAEELQQPKSNSTGSDQSCSALAVATSLGLIGAFESGVDDLSTNPKHMQGFGK